MIENRTKIVMLGTGTPNTDPERNGPCVAVVVDDKAYLVDCGAGVVRQAVKGYRKGFQGLKSENLDICFVTHLHSDHTIGLPDLILSPWVLERSKPLKLYGPKGLKHMTNCIMSAYEADINERLNGFEQANNDGIKAIVSEITEGFIYEDDLVKVEAIRVEHGMFEGSFAYKFYTPDKVVVISGDTYPCDNLIEKSKNCDILVHEVYYANGLKKREKHWQKYHSSVHTSSVELGEIAKKVQPKLLVLYHHLYMIDINTYSENLLSEMQNIEDIILSDIKKTFKGNVVSPKDLDVF